MADPFVFTEEDKVTLVLARVLYLKNCIYRGERPNPDHLHTGSPVFRSTSRTVINLLGYGEGVLDDLLAEVEVLYTQAVKNHEANNNTAA